MQLENHHFWANIFILLQIEWGSTTRALEKPTDIAGFYLKPKVSLNSAY